MRLLLKFNLILILVFGSSVALAGYFSHRFLERSARSQVLEQARLMMGAAGGMRTYTSEQVGPLLNGQRSNGFLPQVVPAYSAAEVFTYLRTTYPDYSYKEASLNPTNVRDRAADWEADVIQIFRDHPQKQEFSAERETPAGRVLFLAKPLFVDMSCLQCHSTPDKAPPAMVKIYGADHGFGWNVGEAIAAQLVSVPMAIPLKIADQAFKALMLSLGGISLLTLIVLDLAVVAGGHPSRDPALPHGGPHQHRRPECSRDSGHGFGRDRRPGAIVQPHVCQPGKSNPHAGIAIRMRKRRYAAEFRGFRAAANAEIFRGPGSKESPPPAPDRGLPPNVRGWPPGLR